MKKLKVELQQKKTIRRGGKKTSKQGPKVIKNLERTSTKRGLLGKRKKTGG